MKDFSGKVAVITGAGRGIGRGIALRCASEEMRVVLVGIGLESLTRTNADLRDMGVETLVVQADVSKLEDVERLAQKTVEAFGEVHMLVNNAGVASRPDTWDRSLADWEWIMGVNFWGVLYGVRTFIPIMMKQETDCHIINVSSGAGLAPGGRNTLYAVSKHGVVVLSEALYFQLAKQAPHIKVSVYCPMWVSSELDDTVERNRPSDQPPPPLTPEAKAEWRTSLATGISIEESADILFKGIVEDKLYIGPKGFPASADPESLISAIRTRAENIINERNPELPS